MASEVAAAGSAGRGRRPDRASGTRPSRFADALTRAQARGAERADRPARARTGAGGPAAPAGEPGPGAPERGAQAAAEPGRDALRDAVEVDPGPALHAALRALPVAIEAARVRDGASLSLALGASLGVELRAGPAGVELLLRPRAGLARATEAELPGLVAALKARGVAVARAAVRPRSPGAWDAPRAR